MKWLKGYSLPKNYVDKKAAYGLLKSLTPDSVPTNVPYFKSMNPKVEAPITINELESCIKYKDTSPGCDNISYSMISNLPSNGKKFLLFIYNTFYSNGFVPKQWRQIAIVPIPKPGRDLTTSSLRPISLISSVCKVFHNILLNRIEWFVEHNHMLSHNTTGFRKGRSTIENLSCLTSRIQIGFSERKLTIACFIDIDNAYNNVDLNSLLDTMDRIGIGAKNCKYIWNFLSERHLRVKGNNYEVTSRISRRGLAQGDPLSPLLFNITTMHICKLFNTVFISQYADDFVLYTTSKTITEASTNLQIALDKFTRLLFDIGLDISTTKTKLCVF